MILLDTNVLSALMQRSPDPVMVRWLDELPADSVRLSSITVFEARYGLALLPEEKRRRELGKNLEALLADDLDGRIAPFDTSAATEAARLAAARRQAGRPIDMRDTFIAGVALAHKASIATRNTRHFSDLPVVVVDPWQPV